MYVFKNELIHPACPKCKTALRPAGILDSDPPYYEWDCECGYKWGSQNSFPMSEEVFHSLIFAQLKQDNVEFADYIGDIHYE